MSRGLGLVLAVALVGAVGHGCGHAKTVGPATPPAAEAPKEAAAPARSDAAERKGRRTTGLTGPHGEAENISIASSPALVLKPGAAKRLQEKLAHDGALHGDVGEELDARTRDALARFQRAHDLPATGIPDDATVRKLGLDPKDVFRSGNDAPP